jgi:aryl-alcohol dehydrogenase-like predicted oxidoreductase
VGRARAGDPADARGTGHWIRAVQPLGKGFLTGTIDDKTTFEPTDFCNVVRRFTQENRKANLSFVEWLKTFAARKNATPA